MGRVMHHRLVLACLVGACSHLDRLADLSNPLQLLGFSSLSVKQVPPELEVHPESGRHPKELGEPKGRSRRDAALAVHQLVDPLVWDMDLLG